MSVSTMRFHIELMFVLKEMKSRFKGSYDKRNLTLVIILYEIYETRLRLVSYEITTRIRSSMCMRLSELSLVIGLNFVSLLLFSYLTKYKAPALTRYKNNIKT